MCTQESVWQRILAWLGQPAVQTNLVSLQTLATETLEGDVLRHRPWTLMVYMAGDNGLVFETKDGRKKLMAEMTTPGYRDIWEMAAIGTTDACAVTCLFDCLDGSFLVEVSLGNGMADSRVIRLETVNTGDPGALRDFVITSIRHYPADRYALVIWNHGTGWLDVDAYASVRSIDPSHRTHSALFRSTLRITAGPGKTRPIAFDDSSKDFLDTRDLHQALGAARDATGRRLDLIGMDACLMAMVEGARELAPYADHFVASQEVEPMDGWPYALILAALNSEPSMSSGHLADRIVGEYASRYAGQTRLGEEIITLSAVALAATAQTEILCSKLVEAILARWSDATLRRLVDAARNQALQFQDRNYRDLGDFASKLVTLTEWEAYPEVTAAAEALRVHLDARGDGSPIVRVAHRPRYQGAKGLSVFLPPRSASPEALGSALDVYRPLAFARATGWDRLVELLAIPSADKASLWSVRS